MDGVRQDKRAGSCRHFRANDCLTEAQFAQYGRHIDPTEEGNDRNRLV